MVKNFVFPNFITPVSVTLRDVLDNDTTTREKTSLYGLGMTKGESVGVYMILKTVIDLDEHETVFNYGPPIT